MVRRSHSISMLLLLTRRRLDLSILILLPPSPIWHNSIRLWAAMHSPNRSISELSLSEKRYWDLSILPRQIHYTTWHSSIKLGVKMISLKHSTSEHWPFLSAYLALSTHTPLVLWKTMLTFCGEHNTNWHLNLF